jgi:hypothetical protein
MDEVKRNANMVRMKLKTMEKALEDEQKGEARHSADFRIRKAQVSLSLSLSLSPVQCRCGADPFLYWHHLNHDTCHRHFHDIVLSA